MTNRSAPQNQTPHQRALADREAAVRALRALDPDAWSYPRLARAFGISLGTAHRIANRKTEEG